MSEMPAKIKIFHTVWWIIEANKDEMEDEYKECLGYTDHIKQYIYIANDQSEENKKTTLFHEILHACIGLSDLKPKKLKKKADIEHAYIGALEYSLISVIQQNPQLTEYLKGKPNYNLDNIIPEPPKTPLDEIIKDALNKAKDSLDNMKGN